MRAKTVTEEVGRGRVLAGLAVVAVLGGAVLMLGGLVAAPGSWLRGYVSEAGVGGLPFAGVYRAGLVVLAAGVACLGLSLRAGLLLVAAVLAGLSGVIPCSAGCPLPPFEASTVADIAHTAASILGMVALAAAMGVRWWVAQDRVSRWMSGIAVSITVPLGVALGLTMLLAGRVPLGAGLERLLLVVAVAWLIGVGLLVAVSPSVVRKTPPRHRLDASP